VDNGSTDDSAEVIPREYPAVTLIENKINLGYTGGNNAGIRTGLKKGAKYIWLLNNDTVVEPGCLWSLVRQAESNPRAGLVSPIVCLYDRPRETQFCGYIADPETFSFIAVRVPGLPPAPEQGQYFVQWGTALLLSRSVLRTIGELDEKYFAYFEDYEFSVRAAKAGYQSVVDSGAVIYHKDSRSTGSRKAPMQVYLRVRNAYFFWMEVITRWARPRYLKRFLVDTLSTAKRFRDEGLLDSSEACLNGGWAAVRNIGGPMDTSVKLPKWLGKAVNWHTYMWIALLKGNYIGIIGTGYQRIKAKVIRRPLS
jgi:GT2 family glycosyltransferase